jgi:LysM repeat protein
MVLRPSRDFGDGATSAGAVLRHRSHWEAGMKRYSHLLAGGLGWLTAFALVLGVMPGVGVARAAPAEQAGQFIKVTVRAGDNLAKYTRIYGVTGAALRGANPQLVDPNIIHPGDIITIPVIHTTTPSLTTPFFYTVQAGDTLLSVARRFEQYPDVIAQTNGLQNDVLVLGRTLLLPAGPHVHFAVQGETLRTIAARYGTTVDFLLTGNSLPNPDRIFVAQPIFIPIIYGALPVAVTPVSVPAPTAAPGATAVPGATATPAPTAIPGSNPNWIRVTVRSGESFVTYVTRFGVTAGLLRQANPQILDPNVIFPGNTVFVPVVVSFTPSRTTPFFYVVQGGETAASISGKFEMTSDTLTRANGGANFAVGSTILVPAGPHLYTVKAGETLSSIAAKFGATVDVLLGANSIPNPNTLPVGQQLVIPTQFNKTPLPFG